MFDSVISSSSWDTDTVEGAPSLERARTLQSPDIPLASVAGHLNEGLVVLSPTGIVLDANQAFLSFSQTCEGQTIGRSIGDFIPDLKNADWPQLWSTAEVNSDLTRQSLTISRSGFPDLGVESRFLVIPAAVTTIHCLIVWPRDHLRLADTALEAYANELQDSYSQRQEHERTVADLHLQLDQARRQLSEQSRRKAQFLANLGHEYRIPLTSLLGYVDLLMNESAAAAQSPWLQVIRRNAENLLAMVDDMLEFSAIDGGEAVVQLDDVPLTLVVSEATDLFVKRAAQKGLALDVSFVGPVPETIRTDRKRLRQTLVQLIGNAIKCTAQGRIQVTVELATPAFASDPLLSLTVTDTGVGIAPDLRDHLFEPFSWGEGALNRRFSGTGLGLAIAQRTARLLGGDLVCDSEPGRGSRFTLTVRTGPLDNVRLKWVQPILDPAPASPPPPPVPAAVIDQLRILVVDDSVDNQRLLRLLLSKAGAKVVLADNGKVACDLVGEGTGEQRFDLVLMDIQMPEMDGYEATRRIRQMGFRRPIIAVTAHAMTGDRERCLAAGCDDYVTKPIDKQSLFATIAHCQAAVGT